MPKKSSFTPDDITDRALKQFWMHGFHATSMDTLVKSTRVSRHGIYTAFGGKKALFLDCFERYQDLIVSPAFERVERADADLTAVAEYYETQIALAGSTGLPGPGCFVANSATEIAPHDAETRAKVAQHNLRLSKGFKNALRNECNTRQPTKPIDVAALAEVFVIFTNGLWSMSRTTQDADSLRVSVRAFLSKMRTDLR